MDRIIFIIGGSRSGKSSFALKEATRLQGKKVYIATAEPFDEEMKERIQRHKNERSLDWLTIEEPVKIPELIIELKGKYNVVLLDCLTLWLSNLLTGSKSRKRSTETIKAKIEKS